MFILKKIWIFLIDSFQTLLLAAAIFLVLYMFVVRPFQVSGVSMFPTYKDREYILTNVIALRLGSLIRGDVIVFKAPNAPDKDYIKRIVGLPGDTVMLHNGSVYVNGKKYDESSYLASDVQTYGGAFLREDQTYTVPKNNYFVLGDNRPESSDSREWGPVSFPAIVGKSFYVYWPLSNMRYIVNPFTHKN